MPRTLQEILDNQHSIAAQFENLEPGDEGADAAPYRELLAASLESIEVQKRLQSAVAGCRDAGVSWRLIGAALGVSTQAAQQRYGTVRSIRRS